MQSPEWLSSEDASLADHHAARQVAGGPWLFTCLDEGRLHPIGYCSKACAHSARDDAEQHYREYLADSAEFGGRWAAKEYRCEVCGTWSDRYAVLASNEVFRLCPAHLNQAVLRSVIAGMGHYL